MRVDLVLANWTLFAEGVWMTLQLTAIALAIGFAIALPAGLARARRVRGASPLVGGYVYLFRGTPLLVQTFLIYYGLAQFEWMRDSWAWAFLREPWWCAVIAFSLNSGAYMTEIVRGAVETTPVGELEAAKALGLSPRQVDGLVLIPSALRRALPQFGNEAVFMLHGSAIASVITLQDILGAGRTLNAKFYLAYEGFLTAAILYMAITFGIVLAFRGLEGRFLQHIAMRPVIPSCGSTRPAWTVLSASTDTWRDWSMQGDACTKVCSLCRAAPGCPGAAASIRLLLDAGVGGVLGALVEAGEDRVGDLLAFDQVDHHRRRHVAHLEGPLADEGGDEALLGERDLLADGVGGADHEIAEAMRSASGRNRSR